MSSDIARVAEAVCAVLGEGSTYVQYYNAIPSDTGWGIFQAMLDHDWEQNFTPEQRAAIAVMYRLT